VCIIHTTNSADLIRELEKAGWSLSRISGSHHIFIKPGHPPLCVPHPRKDLGVGLVHKIRKQAGL